VGNQSYRSHSFWLWLRWDVEVRAYGSSGEQRGYVVLGLSHAATIHPPRTTPRKPYSLAAPYRPPAWSCAGVLFSALGILGNQTPGRAARDFRGAWPSACWASGLGQWVCPQCEQPLGAEIECHQCVRKWNRCARWSEEHGTTTVLLQPSRLQTTHQARLRTRAAIAEPALTLIGGLNSLCRIRVPKRNVQASGENDVILLLACRWIADVDVTE